ncbi:protease inhibitor I42 family protein [Rubritalea marina]|uniref:protease inhibitor I42 family protein n=1 Tax=Rubritalea marina TaxID=361055 RepID=UPI00036EBC6F|nr:protease inhibitor I42 family protein [Rubritalea marina]
MKTPHPKTVEACTIAMALALTPIVLASDDDPFKDVVASFASFTTVSTHEGSSSIVEWNESSNSKDIELQAGQTLRITLTGNPSTGYAWVPKQSDSPLAQWMNKGTNAAQTDQKRTGSPIQQTFEIKALEAGDLVLHFDYLRPWEKKAPSKTLKLRITIQ